MSEGGERRQVTAGGIGSVTAENEGDAGTSGGVGIRLAAPRDAAPFVRLFEALDVESEFMLYERGERRLTEGMMRERIVAGRKSGREILIVAAREPAGGAADGNGRGGRGGDGTLDGFVGAFRPSFYRGAHSLNLVLGVRDAASGHGLGARLLAALEADARTLGIHRLGLGVLATNVRAIALYERAGFVHEGRRRDAVRLRSGLVDELFMGKILKGSGGSDSPSDPNGSDDSVRPDGPDSPSDPIGSDSPDNSNAPDSPSGPDRSKGSDGRDSEDDPGATEPNGAGGKARHPG